MPKLSGAVRGDEPEGAAQADQSAYPVQGLGRLLDGGRGPGAEARAEDPRGGAGPDPQADLGDAAASRRRPSSTTGIVDGDLPLYARAPGNLDTIGIQPLLWGSAQDLQESFKFLDQRRRLTARSNPGAMYWAWIPASAPPIVPRNIWGDDAPPPGASRGSTPSSSG